MIKRVLFVANLLVIFSSTSLHAGHCQAIHDEINGLYYHEDSSLSSSTQKYVSSVLPSVVVGANCGILSAILDHAIPVLWPASWLGSYYLRTHMLGTIIDGYKKKHIRHDRVLMELTSLVCTWISYYKMYEVVHGKPPF